MGCSFIKWLFKLFDFFRLYSTLPNLRLSEFRHYLFGEGFELRDAKLREPFEGHGPEDAGEDYDEEVANDSARVGVAAAKRGEGRGESRLDCEDYSKAYRYLNDLGVPARVGFKLSELAVNYVRGNQADGASHKGAGVLKTALVVMGIEGFVTADSHNENEQTNGKDNAQGNYPRHIFIVLCIINEHRAKQKHEPCGKGERNDYVKEGMNAEVHSREAYEKNDHRTNGDAKLRGLISGDRAESACGILSVARGEGIACSCFLCVAYDLNGGIVYPRTGDTEQKLCSLIKHSAKKTGYENKVALPFVYAPEEENCYCEEEYFLTETGYQREKQIENGVSDLRDSV